MAKVWAKWFYNSRAWKILRAFVLRRDCYTCVDCEARAEEVHHIIELTPENIHDDSVALNPDNLVSLCHNCHTKRTAGVGDIADGYVFDNNGLRESGFYIYLGIFWDRAKLLHRSSYAANKS